MKDQRRIWVGLVDSPTQHIMEFTDVQAAWFDDLVTLLFTKGACRIRDYTTTDLMRPTSTPKKKRR